MNNEKTFEQTLAELEQIIVKLEDQNTPLEDAMKLFAEGVTLSSECTKKLEEAKQAVNMLVDKNGVMTEEVFISDDK